MKIFTKTPNLTVHLTRVLWVCPPRLCSRACQYPTQKGKFLKSIETVAQGCSAKKVFLEISQNSPEKICVWVSILIKFQAKGSHRCFPLKIAKFLRTPFLTEPLQWQLLRVRNFLSVPRLCTIKNTSNSLAQKHTSEHLFYRTAPSGCFQMSVMFLKKGKTETISHTSFDLNTLEIL